MTHLPTEPDEGRLRDLLAGKLTAADDAEVLALLEREPAWQQALDRLAADEALWHEAAVSLKEPPLAADATLRSALAAMSSARSGDAANTPTTGETVDSSAGGASGEPDLSFLTPAAEPGYLGRLGPYLVEEVIGRGGFGVVLKARDPKLARVVAVKVLAPHLAASGTACQRFLREARAAAAVVHEHIITIYAVEDQPLPHLVMQFVAGQSLQEKLDREGPLGVKEVLRIGMQTAAGLSAAHKQGLVHRDIKPANILLENGIERVKITDFGLARAADDASLTRTGVVAGTPQFMSPEQARGATVDARSDVFSLGSVLYAMCAGRPPFRADSTLAVLKRVCDDQARPIRELNPDVPPWLAGIIQRLMAKNPADRPASAQEVADLLGQCLLHLQQPEVAPLPAEVAVLGTPALAARHEPLPPCESTNVTAERVPAAIHRDEARRLMRVPAFALLGVAGLNWLAIIPLIVWLIILSHPDSTVSREVITSIVVYMWALPALSVAPLVTAMLALRLVGLREVIAGTLFTLLTAALINIPFWPVAIGLSLLALWRLTRPELRRALAGIAGAEPPLHFHLDAEPAAEAPARAEKFTFPPKIPKPDPLANAPGAPVRSRLRRALLGVALIAVGLSTLAACAGLAVLLTHLSTPGMRDRPSGYLIINIPDSRLTARLRLEKLEHGYTSGEALRSLHTELEVVSGSQYRLAPGEYRLRVMSDDVIVHGELIRVTEASVVRTHDVKRGGILHLHADPQNNFMSVTINGERCIENTTQSSRRMLVVPEGIVRVKAMWGGHVFAERLVDVKASDEKTLRITPQLIEELPGEDKNK